MKYDFYISNTNWKVMKKTIVNWNLFELNVQRAEKCKQKKELIANKNIIFESPFLENLKFK